MLRLLFYLIFAIVGFVLALVLFPHNIDLKSIMGHKANCADDYYDRIYSRKG